MSASVDRRILGAFRCVDAMTGSAIVEPLMVGAPQWSLKANRSGVYVIFNGPGFEALTTQFVLPATPWPPPISLEITIQDPSQRYLPRRAAISAPLAASSLPQTVALFPAPALVTAPNWSVVRVSVVDAATKAGLPWAIVQITSDSAATKIGPHGTGMTGVTDARGEALLAAPGLKVQIGQSSSGPVTEHTVAATLKAWFDPNVAARPPGWFPNPDDILSNLSSTTLKSATQTARLGVGGELKMTVPITV
ncbi:MAG: hypothetical protein NVS4B13_04100 [Candidatus Elarobacter sp.]